MSEIETLLDDYACRRLSRRTFVRRLLAAGAGLGFAESLLGPGVSRALADPQSLRPRTPFVVMVVLDAFRADYADLAPMPHLDWLASRGVRYPNAWVGQLESYTPAGHATLTTGASPARTGVIGFQWRDPKTGAEDLTAWWNGVMSGRLEATLRAHGVDSIPQAVKRLDPSARVVSLSSEKYYAADAMGGPAADFIMFGRPMGAKIITQGIPHHQPPASFLKAPRLTWPWPLTFGQFDEMAMTMAIEALHLLDPRVLLINLPGADIYGHRIGGPDAPKVMANIVQHADQQIGRLVSHLQRRGILDQTIIVVTADHGMVQNTYQLDDAVIKTAVKKAGGDLFFHVGGSSAYIWLRNPHDSAAVAANILSVLPTLPTNGTTPSDAITFAHYRHLVAGHYRYDPVVAPGTSLSPDLEAAYQYLFGTFNNLSAPDIVLSYPENMISRAAADRHGEHGGATWGAQHVPLVISGPGVRRNFTSPFPARLMDVAPTVFALLGLNPHRMDGLVLADALQHPHPAQLALQDVHAPLLIAHQKAVIAQATLDLAAQAAAGAA
ncbi:MAG TPA: alkaline phosphatase family protein [Chloroflexota bacterium]|nr:alkaline phosphatase family protein [Chloroflexota bacterium]